MFGWPIFNRNKSRNSAHEEKSLSLSDPAIAELFGAIPTTSGVSVTPNSALKVPAVFQAARLISEACGSTPLKLYRDTDGSKEAAKDHPAYRLVHGRANAWTSAKQLRTDLTADAIEHGAGYAHVARTGDGRPAEIHRLAPGSVQRRFRDDGEPFYIVTDAQNRQRPLSFRDVLYVPAFREQSPIQNGKEAIANAILLERHCGQFFGSGARPSGVIFHESKIIPENTEGAKALNGIKRSFSRWRASSNGDPLILDGGWRYDQPAMTSTDAQFLEHRKEQVREIARIFGVPPTMLFELDRGTWSNAEQMAATFLQMALRPWLDRWQDAYTTVLLTEDEQDSLYFEFTTADLERTDAAARAEIYGKMIAARVYTPNEVRARENLPAIEGGDELANPYTTTGPAAGSNDNPSTGKEAA